MKIAGVWVGWGLGDDDPKVADMKGFLRRKFPSYASGLDDSTLYDETTAAVVAAVALERDEDVEQHLGEGQRQHGEGHGVAAVHHAVVHLEHVDSRRQNQKPRQHTQAESPPKIGRKPCQSLVDFGWRCRYGHAEKIW